MAEKRGRGRPRGSLNKATADVKTAARKYSDKALQTLADIMDSSAHPAAARVSAANAILDRAYGKAVQAVDLDASIQATVNEIRRTIVRA